MKKNKTTNYIDFEDVKKENMKDPEFRKAYESVQPEFEIIKALIIARAKNGMTQREFAKKIKMTQSALARFESGRSNPTWSTMKKLVNGLGLKIAII